MPKRVLQGKVISTAADKTISITVERLVKHPLYKKVIKKSKRYMAHDENNACKVGDVVKVIETKPISKSKKWLFVEKV